MKICICGKKKFKIKLTNELANKQTNEHQKCDEMWVMDMDFQSW